jgi:hypothetical protein
MKKREYVQVRPAIGNEGVRAGLLATALTTGAFCALAATALYAQDTTGSIFGHAPAGQTVVLNSNTGMHRNIKVNDDGRYAARALRLGIYTVTLQKDGKDVDTQKASLLTGAARQVNFACPHDVCAKSSK